MRKRLFLFFRIHLPRPDVRPLCGFHRPVIQFLINLQELFFFDVFLDEPVGDVDIVDHHHGDLVAQPFVAADEVSVVVFFQLLDNLGTSEEAEVRETDGLVGHQPVADAVHQEGGSGCLLVLHLAVVRVDGAGEGDDACVVEIAGKNLSDVGAVAEFVVALKHRDGTGAAPAQDDFVGTDVELLGVFNQIGGGGKEVFHSNLDGLVQRFDNFQPAEVHAFQPDAVVDAGHGVALFVQLLGILHVFGMVSFARDKAAAEHEDDAVVVGLGRGGLVQVEVEHARVTLCELVSDGLPRQAESQRKGKYESEDSFHRKRDGVAAKVLLFLEYWAAVRFFVTFATDFETTTFFN